MNCSQYAATVIMCALILVCIAAAAIGYAVYLIREATKRLRAALLGMKLLEVCDGDFAQAEREVEIIRGENECVLAHGVATAAAQYRERLDFGVRRAEFNAACQDLSGVGPRWTDTV